MNLRLSSRHTNSQRQASNGVDGGNEVMVFCKRKKVEGFAERKREWDGMGERKRYREIKSLYSSVH